TTLDKKGQAAWIGWQGAFWNGGRVFATAVIVLIAASLQEGGMSAKAAWALALAISMATMAGIGLYHIKMLPSGSVTRRPRDAAEVLRTFGDQIVDFLRKPQLWLMLLFVFLYRSGEGFLLVEAP